MKIVILSRKPSLYFTRRLREAGEQRGHDVPVIDYLRCYMNITASKPQVIFGGHPIQDVDAIIPRIGGHLTFAGGKRLRPMLTLLAARAAGFGGDALALTYPRETWFLRLAFPIINFLQKFRRDPFRIFLHPVSEVDSLLKRQGFERITHRRLFVWEMAIYQRV